MNNKCNETILNYIFTTIAGIMTIGSLLLLLFVTIDNKELSKEDYTLIRATTQVDTEYKSRYEFISISGLNHVVITWNEFSPMNRVSVFTDFDLLELNKDNILEDRLMKCSGVSRVYITERYETTVEKGKLFSFEDIESCIAFTIAEESGSTLFLY